MENNNTVKITKRLYAYIIDIFILFIILGLVSQIKFINPTYDKYNEAYIQFTESSQKYIDNKIDEKELLEVYNEEGYLMTKYGVSYSISNAIGIFLYFVIFQKYNKGQTIGKKLLKIKVVNENNETPSVSKFLIRYLPYYSFYIGGGIIPIIINAVLIFILNKTIYLLISGLISYIFVGIFIACCIVLLIRKDKKGLHDILANTKVVNE